MERTNNLKQRFSFFKKNKFNNHYQSNNFKNANKNTSCVSNSTMQNSETTDVPINKSTSGSQNTSLIEIKNDFSISYKDKTYIYEIPEAILQKEMNSIPFWLLPVHVKLIPNGNDMLNFCNEIETGLSKTGARIEIENQSGDIKKKIRNAELKKIPYIIIIGPKEKSIHKFIVRTLDGNQKLLSVGAFSHILDEQLLNKPKSKLC